MRFGRLLLSTATVVASVATSSRAASSTGNTVLVVLEPKLKQDDYSQFFDSLTARGYDLTFRAPRDASPVASTYGIPTFCHIILFAPTTKSLADDLSSQSIVKLLSSESPVNVLVALSTATSQTASLAVEFGLQPAPPNTPLISHFPARSGPHSIVPITIPERAPYLPKLAPILNNGSNVGPILFSGSPHYTNDNPLLVDILKAPAESFATETESDGGAGTVVDTAEKGGEGLWAGSSLGVVTGFQARSGARVVFTGGVKMFSNEYFDMETSGQRSGNSQFAKDLTAWTFKESLVLRLVSGVHFKTSEGPSAAFPEKYTVNEQTTAEIQVEAWDAASSSWVPASKLDDVQLEFTMLDPHVRTVMFPVAGRPGFFSVSFQVPDRHGVFKFIVDYRRKGYSHVFWSSMVSVVPKRHDEYDRFIPAAWPYYAGALSTSVGFVLFSILYLGGEVDRVSKGKSKVGKSE